MKDILETIILNLVEDKDSVTIKETEKDEKRNTSSL